MPMAKKAVLPNCNECMHHHSLHEIGANGKPFLCKCWKHPERSRFITKDGCNDFKKQM